MNPTDPDPKTKTPRTDKAANRTRLPNEDGETHYLRAIEQLRNEAATLELETQSLTRRLEEVTKDRERLREAGRQENFLVMDLRSKLTALRTAAEGAIPSFGQALRQWQGYADGKISADYDSEDLADAKHAEAEFYRDGLKALAALRAELDQADSNASNSPTASRESQG